MKNAIAVALCFFLAGCFPNYSNGERVGTVIKLSKKGLIFKSWEGELYVGGGKGRMTEGSGRVNFGSFTFNTADERIVKQLQDAMKSGVTVELVYREWLVSPPWIDNSHVVVEVKPAG